MSTATVESLRPSATAAEAPAAPKRRLPFSPRTAIVVAIALIAAVAGAVYIVLPKGDVSTDAAYLEADSSTVSPRIRGLVAEVLVTHNQPVKAGQPLVRIDPEEFDAREAAAAANLQTAQAAVLAAKAAFGELDAQERLADSGIAAAKASVAAGEAQSEQAASDRARFESLAQAGAASKRDADQFRASAISAASEAERLRAQLGVSQSQAAATRAKRQTLGANLAQAEAQAASAQAALDLARQDKAHTTVNAPIDGVVGDRQVEPGDFVQPGTRLMTIVPLDALYVTANFKETQVSRMTAGQVGEHFRRCASGRDVQGQGRELCAGLGLAVLVAAVRAGHGQFHQGRAARAGAHPA